MDRDTLIVETVLTVSAIPIGGHHLIDVLAGAPWQSRQLRYIVTLAYLSLLR